jgi:ClpA/ClpB-like protein
MRCCEPELSELLKLNTFEETLRANLPKMTDRAIYTDDSAVPLSNQSKRVLAYAAEEAERLRSLGIRAGHLLLGILREQESFACGFLSARGIDLTTARQVIASLPPEPSDPMPQAVHKHLAWRRRTRRLSWISGAAQIGLLMLLAILTARSHASGKHLLMTGVAWMLVVCAWLALRKERMWGFKFSNRHRVIATSIIYVVVWLYQILLYGWVIPLGIGIYRTIAWRP